MIVSLLWLLYLCKGGRFFGVTESATLKVFDPLYLPSDAAPL